MFDELEHAKHVDAVIASLRDTDGEGAVMDHSEYLVENKIHHFPVPIKTEDGDIELARIEFISERHRDGEGYLYDLTVWPVPMNLCDHLLPGNQIMLGRYESYDECIKNLPITILGHYGDEDCQALVKFDSNFIGIGWVDLTIRKRS
jgi:hypothetical protein